MSITADRARRILTDHGCDQDIDQRGDEIRGWTIDGLDGLHINLETGLMWDLDRDGQTVPEYDPGQTVPDYVAQS